MNHDFESHRVMNFLSPQEYAHLYHAGQFTAQEKLAEADRFCPKLANNPP
jgi:hypothetical protein